MEVFAAGLKKARGAGVAVDGAVVGDLVFLGDPDDAVPVEEFFFDGVAVGVRADGALAGVTFEEFRIRCTSCVHFVFLSFFLCACINRRLRLSDRLAALRQDDPSRRRYRYEDRFSTDGQFLVSAVRLDRFRRWPFGRPSRHGAMG